MDLECFVTMFGSSSRYPLLKKRIFFTWSDNYRENSQHLITQRNWLKVFGPLEFVQMIEIKKKINTKPAHFSYPWRHPLSYYVKCQIVLLDTFPCLFQHTDKNKWCTQLQKSAFVVKFLHFFIKMIYLPCPCIVKNPNIVNILKDTVICFSLSIHPKPNNQIKLISSVFSIDILLCGSLISNGKLLIFH